MAGRAAGGKLCRITKLNCDRKARQLGSARGAKVGAGLGVAAGAGGRGHNAGVRGARGRAQRACGAGCYRRAGRAEQAATGAPGARGLGAGRAA